MGIVVTQSIKNTIITYIGFAIGAANALFMYPHFLGKTFYGLTGFLLSAANVMMPLMAFGVHNTLVKFYSGYETEEARSRFLSFVLILPLILILPIAFVGYIWYEPVATYLSEKNPIIFKYVWMIPVIGLFMGYFEIFYAWVRVHLKSIFGNFIKEVLQRVLISICLIAVFFKLITPIQFIYATVGIYFLTMCVMIFFAFKVRRPVINFKLPENCRPILVYSMFIILSGSVAVLLLDIDKVMIAKYLNVDNIAYYSVAIFIATVVAVPSRAMHQITYPLTAKLMAEEKHSELNTLYKKTSITLQIVGGYVLLGILVNINSLYAMLPTDYSRGLFVVFAIGLSKYFDLILGNNNAIIFNSKYYRAVLALGLLLAALAISLNMVFIPRFGINGAAVATLLAITLYSLAKLMFVVVKLRLFPFTRTTLKTLCVSLGIFFTFCFWNFPVAPFFNIILKSVLLTIVYWYVCFKLNLSEDINQVLERLMTVSRLR